eukprot:CAMPEP_0176137802 /NCGR_PEP_ID=MMETSP0120_2-20121206/69971_1 /TAXON_ID=160619 /ORGANISM="Kryptoperidinium foliaceum, Strain CCMP 1326" /LENGTH=40 /DNA_ID= /DNA_START= /DNA_END= /DNA_ORIENTATION=
MSLTSRTGEEFATRSASTDAAGEARPPQRVARAETVRPAA